MINYFKRKTILSEDSLSACITKCISRYVLDSEWSDECIDFTM